MAEVFSIFNEPKEEFRAGVFSDFNEPRQPVSASGVFSAFNEPVEITPSTGDILGSIVAGGIAGATFIPQTAASGIQVLEDITGLDLFGKELDTYIDEARDFWVSKIGKSKTEQLLGQAAQTIGALGSTAALLTITAGSTAGLLPVMAAGAGLETTAEALEEGAPRLNAYGAGFVSAGTEYLTEKIPIGILQKPGISFLKRLAGGVISDIPGELIATATEMKLIDEQILGKDPISTEDFIQVLKDTAAVSAISTVGLSGGAQLIDSARRRGKPTPEDEVSDAGIPAPNNIADALQEIVQPPPSELIVPEEKQEVEPVNIVDRDDSKSEFPELESQTDQVSPDQTIDPTDNVAVQKDLPAREVYNNKNFEDLKWVQVGKASDAYSKQQRGFSFQRFKRALVRGFIDVSGNIKSKLTKLGNDGKRAAMQRDALAGAHSKALKILDTVRREIFGGVKKEHRQMFDLYLSAKRHLEIKNRLPEFQLPEGTTIQDLTDYMNAIPAELQVDFDARTEQWSARMGEVLDLMNREGLISDKQAVNLRAQGKYYVPRQILDMVDPTTTSLDRQGRRITVRDSGLKNLSEDGSDKLIEMDAELLLQQIYERAFTRVFKNRANLELLRVARNQPNNGLVREARVVGRKRRAYQIVDKRTGELIEDEAFESKKEAEAFIKGEPNAAVKLQEFGEPIFEKPKPAEGTVSVMDGGKKKTIIMPLEMAAEWVRSDPTISPQLASAIGWLTGTKLLKSMATTLNPEFAITNIPRDIAHIYLTTDQYSSFAPKFALQMGRDLINVAKDAITKKGMYDRYIDNGGGTEFLTYQGRLKAKGKLGQAMGWLENIMGWAGERSEIMTRLALMNRAIRNGKSDFEAAQVARGYLDFSQGGSVSKALDAGIPFFNASIQASRGIFRAAKTDPKTFGFKVMNLGVAAMSLYWANKFMYGDDLDDVTDTERRNNWIIMTPYTFLDKDGEQRRYYLRVPKDQGQRVFTEIFEGMARKALGDEVDVDQIADAAKDFIPVSAYELMPPTLEALMGYAVNKDFWRREDIWRGEDVLPQEEYNKYTPEAYVKLGKATGWSPVRMKYALEQVFTQGNIWTSLVGFGAEQVFSELTPEQRDELTKEMLEKRPGVRRFLRSTRPATKREEQIREEKRVEDTRRLIQRRGLEEIADAHLDGRVERRELTEFISRQPVEDRARLRTRFKNMRQLKDIPNRRFWLSLKQLPPESRATNYWNEWVQLSPEERIELDRQSRKVKGFRSKRFNRSFNKLKRLGDGR